MKVKSMCNMENEHRTRRNCTTIYALLRIADMRQHIPKAAASTATMVEPTGVPARIDMMMPQNAQITERVAEKMVTALKLPNSRIAESAGKITSADIRSDPTRFMASTMITAITTAIRVLYLSAPTPVAFEKFSSKVTANILL